jgi:hypothetical protein
MYIVQTISAPNEHKALTQCHIQVDGVLSHTYLSADTGEDLLRHCHCISEIYSKLKRHHSTILLVCKKLLQDGDLSMSESLLQHNDDVSDICDFLLQYNVEIQETYNKILHNPLISDRRLQNCIMISAACNDLTELCAHICSLCENLQYRQGDVTCICRKLLRYCSNFSIICNHLRQSHEKK